MKIALTILTSLILHTCFGQESSKANRVLVGLELNMYNSKPAPDRTAEQDPGIMLHLSYPLGNHFAAGLGTGLVSPYYTSTLLPAYVQASVWPAGQHRGWVFVSRIGQFMATSQKNYRGGMYGELTAGYDFAVTESTRYRMGMGYSHQRMTSENLNFWWGDQNTDYRFNRAVFSLGMIF